MFDFGDLLALPVLVELDSTNKWILEFVDSASEGSLLMFESALGRHQQQATVSPIDSNGLVPLTQMSL